MTTTEPFKFVGPNSYNKKKISFSASVRLLTKLEAINIDYGMDLSVEINWRLANVADVEVKDTNRSVQCESNQSSTPKNENRVL